MNGERSGLLLPQALLRLLRMQTPDQHQFITICCTGCGDERRVPVYCGDRFCTICSVGRRSRVRKRLEFLISSVKLKEGEGFKHLSLGIKNQPDLPSMLKKLSQAFRKLRSRPLWKSRVRAGAMVIEVTGGPENWHAHLHIVLVSAFLPWKELHAAWLKCSGGISVWIDTIPPTRAVSYLTKYLSKPGCNPDDLILVNPALYKFRLFQPFGEWHALNIAYIKPPVHCQKCGGTHYLPLVYFLAGLMDHPGDVHYARGTSPPKKEQSAEPSRQIALAQL